MALGRVNHDAESRRAWRFWALPRDVFHRDPMFGAFGTQLATSQFLMRPSRRVGCRERALGALVAFAFAAPVLGCSGGETDVDAGSAMRTITGVLRPEPAPDVQPTDVTLDASITSMATSEHGLWLGTERGLYAFSGGEPRLAEARLAGGEAAPVGAVRAVLALRGEALVASESGLFQTDGAEVRLSPASDALGALDIVAMDAPAGSADETWIAATDALYHVQGSQVTRYRVADVTGAPSAVAAGSDAVFVAFGERLFAVHHKEAEVFAEELELGLGPIHAIELDATGSLFVATNEGLCVRGKDGALALYTLADGGERTPVRALAAGHSGGVYAATPEGLVVVSAGEQPLQLAPLALVETASALAVDTRGAFWVASGGVARGLDLGVPPSFAADIAPILEDNCAGCHTQRDDVPRIDFADLETVRARADRIAKRISDGRMPPPPNPPVAPEDYEVIVRWIGTGKQP